MSLSANLLSDKDYVAKSEDGFVSIVGLEKISETLGTLNIKRVNTKKHSEDFVVFKLPWKYTEKQLLDFKEHNVAKMQKFNHIVLVDNVVPVLFLEIEELMKAVYENVRGMGGPVEREVFGYATIRAVIQMAYFYLDLANGRINKIDCLKRMKIELKVVKYQTKLIADMKIWTPKTCARIGETIIKVQDVIEREIKNV